PEGVTYTGTSAADALDTIDTVLREYVQRVAPSKLFTMEEAAEYLGVGIDQMYTYVSRQKVLRGLKIGRSTVFTQAELDTFNRHQRLRRGERRTV
ncbi:MAG: DNA-binding protein, partial [Desulfurellales bacterium]